MTNDEKHNMKHIATTMAKVAAALGFQINAEFSALFAVRGDHVCVFSGTTEKGNAEKLKKWMAQIRDEAQKLISEVDQVPPDKVCNNIIVKDGEHSKPMLLDDVKTDKEPIIGGVPKLHPHELN